jgi:tetratricopeptide (TPR) repeat protein/V8-like Glu-specific endopeptidase
MKYSVPIGCAILVCSYSTIAQSAPSTSDIYHLAKSVTVKIQVKGQDGSSSQGSGILVHKQGTKQNLTYTLITNKHVVCGSSRLGCKYTLITPDGRTQQVRESAVRNFKNELDLSSISFPSDRTYSLAKLGNSDQLKVGEKVYTAGFPTGSTGFSFSQGSAVAVVGKSMKGDHGGYTIAYSAFTLPGMSGSGVFNSAGQVVAIHGVGDRYQKNAAIGQNLDFARKIGLNRGIPVNRLIGGAQQIGLRVGSKMLPLKTASTPITADEYFILGFNKLIIPTSDPRASKLEAIRNFKQATKLNPQYADAHYLLGYTYAQLNMFAPATTSYGRAIQLNPNDYLAYNHRGLLKYTEVADANGAIADFTKAIALNSQYVDAYNNRGIARYEALEDGKGALADFNQAITIKPEDASGYNNRGLIKQFSLQDFPGALADFNKSLALNPLQTDTYTNRGSLKKDHLRDVQGALADFNRAIELDPNSFKAYNNRGNLKDDQLKDYRGAEADYSKAIAINSRDPLAYYNRGLMRVNRLTNRTGAIADFRQALQLFQQRKQEKYAARARQQLQRLGVTS